MSDSEDEYEPEEEDDLHDCSPMGKKEREKRGGVEVLVTGVP
jgi:hypothetical protein